ncbi:MAG TPA: DMT family transporter [Candidatus Sumerlaeota bacterium]|nr:DMT family transporter [Candidatus Sumerlaeota bacterium]
MVLLFSIVLWGIGPLFIKYFTRFYDPWTQNAFRYSCAALMLLLAVPFQRRTSFRLTRGQWIKLGLVVLPNVGLQITYASMFYFLYPSVAGLVVRTSILFVCFLSFLFFADERPIIRSGGFLLGAVLGLVGLVAIIAGQDPEILSRLQVSQTSFWIGVAIALGYAFFLAVYTLMIKRLVRDVPPIVSFTHVSWMTSVVMILLMLKFGRPSDLWTAPLEPLGWMVFTAFVNIIVAHTTLYAALREIKAVVSSTLMLLTPFITCVGSVLIYGDRLSAVQIAGGGSVLVGAWLAGLAQARLQSRPADLAVVEEPEDTRRVSE